MATGSRWVYRKTDADGAERRVEATVTRRTKTVLGIEARVVRDVVTEHGRIRETTDDWFAQDVQGNTGIWTEPGVSTVTRGSGRLASRGRPGSTGVQPWIVRSRPPDPGTVYQPGRAAAIQVLISRRCAGPAPAGR